MPCWLTRVSTSNCWAKNPTQKMHQQWFLPVWRKASHSTHTVNSATSTTLYTLLKASAECLKTHWNTQNWMTQFQRTEWYSDKQSFQLQRTALQVSMLHFCQKLVVSVACINETFLKKFFLSICLDRVESKQCNTAQEIKDKFPSTSFQ